MADDVDPIEMRAWLDANIDKAGTPDYVRVTEAYANSQKTPYDDPGAAGGVGQQSWTDEASRIDPNTPMNIGRRVVTGAVTGLPDLAIAGFNAGSRAGISPETQLPYLGPQAINAVGGLPMAADASTQQQLLEGGGSALLGGGGQAVARTVAAAPTALRALLGGLSKFGSTVATPMVTGHYGSQAGETIANKFGWDPETGALIGAVLGGGAPGALDAARRNYTDWRYRGMGRENAPEIAAAAAREDVRLPASALGNDTIRMRENTYANRYGASDYTQGLRTGAREGVGAAWDDMATARGALDPVPTTGTVGGDVGVIANRGALEAQRRSSAGQESLMQRVGPTSPADISGVLAEMERVARTTDPITARPIATRVEAARGMLPRDPITGDILSTDVDYQRLKDLRTGLRLTSEGYPAMQGRHAGDVYDAMTQAMRDTAAASGVPPNVFDIIQQRTARLMGEGGPHEQLTTLNDQVTNNAQAGYNYLKRGEQDPSNLRLLQSTGQPEVPSTFGDYLRLMGNQTINSQNQGAPGPRQLATRVENMNPESRQILTGPQDPRAMDIAMLARAINAPTRQGGLGQTMGNLNQGIAGSLTAGEVGHAIGTGVQTMTGLPGAPTAGRVAGYLTGPIQRAVGGRLMQSPGALNALAGGPRPNNYTISDLVAAINAASAPMNQGRPLPERQ